MHSKYQSSKCLRAGTDMLHDVLSTYSIQQSRVQLAQCQFMTSTHIHARDMHVCSEPIWARLHWPNGSAKTEKLLWPHQSCETR